MWHVTGDTALNLDRWVFVDKGARLVRVAVETDDVLRGTGPLLPGPLRAKAAVRVVAIGAFY